MKRKDFMTHKDPPKPAMPVRRRKPKRETAFNAGGYNYSVSEAEEAIRRVLDGRRGAALSTAEVNATLQRMQSIQQRAQTQIQLRERMYDDRLRQMQDAFSRPFSDGTDES